MKKYAILVALAISPSLAHDGSIEGLLNNLKKPKLAVFTEPHHAHLPLEVNNPFDERNTADKTKINKENLERMIAEAEKTIEKLDSTSTENHAEKDVKISAENEHAKFSFNKWSDFKQNTGTGSYYLTGEGSKGAGGSGGGSAGGGAPGGGTSGGGAPGKTSTADNDNPSAHGNDVVATAVPEPEIYVMFLAGLGLIGYKARKSLAKRLIVD
jgi:hypothetical protein